MTEIIEYTNMLHVMYTEDEALQWLNSENKLLGGEKAIDLIERGEGEKVKQVIQQLSDCVYL